MWKIVIQGNFETLNSKLSCCSSLQLRTRGSNFFQIHSSPLCEAKKIVLTKRNVVKTYLCAEPFYPIIASTIDLIEMRQRSKELVRAAGLRVTWRTSSQSIVRVERKGNPSENWRFFSACRKENLLFSSFSMSFLTYCDRFLHIWVFLVHTRAGTVS